MPSIAASASLTVRWSALRIKLLQRCADQTRRAAFARKDKAVRLDGQKRRRHALARNDDHQIPVIGHRAAERPRIIEDGDVVSPDAPAPSGAVGVAPAFALQKDEQLV